MPRPRKSLSAVRSSEGPKRATKSDKSVKAPAVLVPLSAQTLLSYRDTHIQESQIENLFGDGNTAVIYHKIISVRSSAALTGMTGNDLSVVAQLCAENVVISSDNPQPLMSFEDWMEIDLGSLSKIVEAMSNNVGKD